MTKTGYTTLILLVVATLGIVLAACETPPSTPGEGELATVLEVLDGDTIDVALDGETYRVRYIGVNTPERDEVCFDEARAANTLLVGGQRVRMLGDISETDQYGRLLRYVYVGDLFVNAKLVELGMAEARAYPPDVAFEAFFEGLEQQARDQGIGCWPTGVFGD